MNSDPSFTQHFDKLENSNIENPDIVLLEKFYADQSLLFMDNAIYCILLHMCEFFVVVVVDFFKIK